MKLLTQLVREILHLSGKGPEISKTSGCGNHVFLLTHRNDHLFTLCIYVTYHYKRQLINSKLATVASEYLNVKMININCQHSPKCDLICFGLFCCFLSLYFFFVQESMQNEACQQQMHFRSSLPEKKKFGWRESTTRNESAVRRLCKK